jgi:hypothetical protein
MDNLLLIVFLVSLGCLVVGLIRPTVFRSLLKEKTGRKRVAYVFGGTMIGSLILLTAILPPAGKQPTDTASSSTSTQQVATEPVAAASAPAKTEPKPAEPAPKPVEVKAPEPSEDERIRTLVRETFKGTNNMKKERLRKVDVKKLTGGGWGVSVDFNADENLTTNLTKKGIESDMSEAYTALYTANMNVKQASVAAFFPLRDEYGNDMDGIVYKTLLTSDVADKINWQSEKLTLRARIIPGLWETAILNVSFR